MRASSVMEPQAQLRSYLVRYTPEMALPDQPEEPWNVPDLCAAYSWPTRQPGGGVIAIIEPWGGWNPSDMESFFQGIAQPMPQITDVSVDGAANAFGTESDDREVALDIQTAAASYYCATGMPATIRVYWIPQSPLAQAFTTGVERAIADGCDVCSISWGYNETFETMEGAQGIEQAAIEAAAAGMIVFAAAGNNDSSVVQLPASAPHVISCGGTTKSRARATETVWNNTPGSSTGNGTGGGFSTVFHPMPPWQVGAPHGPGRMIPDVAANADPRTGYRIVVHGQPDVTGGTSAVAPLYAGLFASFGRKLGFVAPELWSHPTCFQDITSGDNGAYRALQGPDPCTGLGVPIGDRLAALLTRSARMSGEAARLAWYRARARLELTYAR
jgi:subtilase family serine protease